MRATDQMLARYQGEIDERQAFVDKVVEAAEGEGRDLTAQELELVTRARDRQTEIAAQIEPLKESARIAADSQQRIGQLHELQQVRSAQPPASQGPDYRTAGEFILDFWRGSLGNDDARQRVQLYERAAAHQTTADNPGLLPEKILGPVVNFVDTNRAIIQTLGARQLPSGSWSRPKITQHTTIGEQATQKTELVSQKMTIGKLPVSAKTYGGYVNVSRQDVDWSQPGIMDIILSDLAGVYAGVTEDAAGDALVAAAVAGPTIPTGTPTPAAIAAAIWTAVGSVYAATKGQGRVVLFVATDMLGMLGPAFAPVNPQNAQSAGFEAGNYQSGLVGAISGVPVIMSPVLANGTMLVASTAAAEFYEDRIGALQVVEPSVLGIQVAYAGYAATLIIEAAGIVKITKTP